jgi:hypothetical protein
VSAKPVTDSEMKARLTEIDREIELQKKEKDSEVAALKRQLEVRNSPVYKVFHAQTSRERHLESFCKRYACDSSSHLSSSRRNDFYQ